MIRSSIRVLRHAETPKGRLLCFPYAGGSTSLFREWPKSLPESIEVAAVALPGREARVAEPFAKHVDEITESVAATLCSMREAPLFLFGQSMGAVFSLELAHRLNVQHGVHPVCLFASGSEAPHLCEAWRVCTLDDACMESIADERWDGIPSIVRANPEVLSTVLSTVRADLAVLATCAKRHDPPIQCPIHVFGGDRDGWITRPMFDAWAEHTSADTTVEMFSGGHLFVIENESAVLDSIRARIAAYEFPLLESRLIAHG